jgi:delta24-sterol reductase
MTREPTYKAGKFQLDIGALSRVLELDQQTLVVVAESLVSMEELFTATMSIDCLPEVLPEFRKITVGGAITGAGLESSSHRYGHFHTTCNWVEVLLADGRVIRCDPNSHSDLWNLLPGSYGTLGIVTRACIRLVRAAPFVRLHYHMAPDMTVAIPLLRYACLLACVLAPVVLMLHCLH